MSIIHCFKPSSSEDSYTDSTVEVLCDPLCTYARTGSFNCIVHFKTNTYVFKCAKERVMVKKFFMVLGLDDVTEDILIANNFKVME